MLCSNDLAAKTYDDIVAAMNVAGDVQQELSKKHFAAFLGALSPEETDAFRAFLDKSKLATSYVRIDNRTLYASGERDIRADLRRQCDELAPAAARVSP